MKFSQLQFEEKVKTLKYFTHDENIKKIFQWVKDGKINPSMMNYLVLESYKINIDTVIS